MMILSKTEESLILEGTIDNVVFYNEENDYSVLEICRKEDNLIITAVGNMPIPFAGENVVLRGSWTYHKEFGKQFVISSFEKTLPVEIEGILQYLSSRTVKGIGPATAKKIVDRFGAESFDVIENHPEWLADINGITMKKASAISKSFREQTAQRDVIMFCKDYMTVADAARVYKRLGPGAVGIIIENPYVLCDGDCSISFSHADEIAASLGFKNDNSFRIQSGIRYTLKYNESFNGHTCLPKDKLIAASANLLGVSTDKIEEALSAMSEDDVAEYAADGTVFVMLRETSEKEDYIAQKLDLLDRCALPLAGSDITSLISAIESRYGIEYERLQKNAIFEALRGGVMIITGGPGTGKTTIVKALISIFKGLNLKVVLAAPTGRAAKRLSEATSHEAKTIHRMLEMEKGNDVDIRFGRNAINPIDEDVCIVDEASMVDISLMYALMRALKRGSRLIMIGDSNQLPSVGAGNVLMDLIESNKMRTVALTEIFRQSKESLIVTNAHKINRGEYPILSSVDADFFFVNRPYEKDIPTTIASLITERLPLKYGNGIAKSIQVITPSKKGFGGVETLNAELQARMNPKSRKKMEKSAHNTVFREGDRVMQNVNNYEIEWERNGDEGTGVFNGDIGIIEKIDLENSTLSVRFDDRKATYGFDNLDELDLAYAITVHKSQGSEYPVVIIPMYLCPPMLLTRNLLYTAVTRAKRMVILVGRSDVVNKMVDNNSEILRYTTLKYRIVGHK